MKNQNAETGLDVKPEFTLVRVQDGKYHVRFPFIPCPVEMNEKFYMQLIREHLDKSGDKTQN